MYRIIMTQWAVDIEHPCGGWQGDAVTTKTRKQAFGQMRAKHGPDVKISIRALDELDADERHRYVDEPVAIIPAQPGYMSRLDLY